MKFESKDPYFTRFPTSIAKFVEHRRFKLGLRKGDVIHRLGYKNFGSGLTNYDRFLEGKIHNPFILEGLPKALEVPVETIRDLYETSCDELEEAERKEREARERRWRAAFRPHAEILTERAVISPLFMEVFTDVRQRYKKVYFRGEPPVKYVDVVLEHIAELKAMGETNPLERYYGEIKGFVINYSPDRAVEYDLNGNPIREYDEAYSSVARIAMNVGGKELTPKRVRHIWKRLQEAEAAK